MAANGSTQFPDIGSPREIRRRLGLNQHDFWAPIGVSQSGGSRYESGRRMPKPVRARMLLVHGQAHAAVRAFAEARGVKLTRKQVKQIAQVIA